MSEEVKTALIDLSQCHTAHWNNSVIFCDIESKITTKSIAIAYSYERQQD
jgi:hypothetical protein